MLSRKSFELKLSGPLVVQDQWIEIRPQQSFTAERDRQFIVLELEPPFSYDFYRQGRGPNAGEGILMPDKGVLNPEIKVVDEQGNNLDLVYRGARRTFWPAYGLPYPQEFPKDPKYKHVRLRSEQPISVKAVEDQNPGGNRYENRTAYNCFEFLFLFCHGSEINLGPT